MHIPCLLPDEFLPGYLGRVARLNGITSGYEMKFRIKTSRLPHEPTPLAIEWLAQTCQMPLDILIQQHTLIPLFRAVREADRLANHGDRNTIKHYGMRLPSHQAKLCRNCVTEDRSFWGFSYWRRSHQVPGVSWCTKHETQLSRTAQRPDLFSFPEEELQAEDLVSFDLADLTASTRRYADISMGLLDLSSPLPTVQVALRLQAQARRLGLRTSIIGKQSNISDCILTEMPTPWLLAHFPALQNKVAAQHISSIDGVCNTSQIAFRSSTYALVAAALYGSADEALMEFTSPLTDVEQAYIASRADFRTAAQIGNALQTKLRQKKHIRREYPTLRKSSVQGEDFRAT